MSETKYLSVDRTTSRSFFARGIRKVAP